MSSACRRWSFEHRSFSFSVPIVCCLIAFDLALSCAFHLAVLILQRRFAQT